MPARRGSVVDAFMDNVLEDGHVPWYKKVVLEEAGLPPSMPAAPSVRSKITDSEWGAAGMGGKTIGWGGSIVLLINNITGPG